MKEKNTPPRWAAWLLSHVRLRGDSDILLGDFEEEYHFILQRFGPASARSKRALEGGRHLGRFFNPHPDATERFGDFRKIDRAESPHLPPPLVRVPSIRAIEMRDLLIESAVVVDDDHQVDAVARCSFQLGEVIVKTAVSRKTDDRRAGKSTLHSKRPGKTPAQ